jgi:hypothetical protein
MEGKLCYGRTNAIRDSTQRRGEYGFPVPRVQHLKKTGYKIFDGMKNVGWRVSAIGRDDLSGTPTNCPSR